MKTTKLLFLILGLCFSLQTLSATNPISVESYEELADKAESKQGIFSKAKKWFKTAADKVKIKKLATAALILGIVSLAGWVFIALGIGFGTMLIVMGILALAADILAIIVLVKTAKEKGEHKRSRKKAIWGLVTALLTGLIPIFFLAVVLALLSGG